MITADGLTKHRELRRPLREVGVMLEPDGGRGLLTLRVRQAPVPSIQKIALDSRMLHL